MGKPEGWMDERQPVPREFGQRRALYGEGGIHPCAPSDFLGAGRRLARDVPGIRAGLRTELLPCPSLFSRTFVLRVSGDQPWNPTSTRATSSSSTPRCGPATGKLRSRAPRLHQRDAFKHWSSRVIEVSKGAEPGLGRSGIIEVDSRSHHLWRRVFKAWSLSPGSFTVIYY